MPQPATHDAVIDATWRLARRRAPHVLPPAIAALIDRDLYSVEALRYLPGAEAHGTAIAREILAMPLPDGVDLD